MTRENCQCSPAPSLWIVGQVDNLLLGENSPWSFRGVFDSEASAIAACADATYFIGPAILNQTASTWKWIGSYYPKQREH